MESNSYSLRDEITYKVEVPTNGWRLEFDQDYAEILRPIAETLAMLDGNAFFTFENHWRGYLTEADAVFANNGGINGWAGEVSWVRELRMIQEDPTLRDAYDKLQMLLALKRKENGNI